MGRRRGNWSGSVVWEKNLLFNKRNKQKQILKIWENKQYFSIFHFILSCHLTSGSNFHLTWRKVWSCLFSPFFLPVYKYSSDHNYSLIMISLLGITYTCDQPFLIVKHSKNKSRMMFSYKQFGDHWENWACSCEITCWYIPYSANSKYCNSFTFLFTFIIKTSKTSMMSFCYRHMLIWLCSTNL